MTVDGLCAVVRGQACSCAIAGDSRVQDQGCTRLVRARKAEHMLESYTPTHRHTRALTPVIASAARPLSRVVCTCGLWRCEGSVLRLNCEMA